MAQWKDIKGFEGLYQISDEGQVKSLANRFKRKDGRWYEKKERIVKAYLSTHGYPTLSLCKGGAVYKKMVHRLVAEAFIPNPENKPEIDHIDGNRANPNVKNLHWVTHKENFNMPLFLSKRSGAGNPMFGRHTSEKQKEMLAQLARERHGSKHPSAVKIKNITTGKIYGAIVEAAADLKVTPGAIWAALKKKTPCRKNYFEYLSTEKETS